MIERCRSLAVGNPHVRALRDEQAHDLGVRGPAVAENDGFEQRGPAQPVDMVDVDRGVEQDAHRLDMAVMGGRDQRRPAIAVDRLEVGPMRERQAQDRIAPFGSCIEIWAVVDPVLRVDVGARLDQHSRGLDPVGMRRQQQSGAPLAVARVDRRTRGQQACAFAGVAASGGAQQVPVGGADILCACHRGHARAEGQQQEFPAVHAAQDVPAEPAAQAALATNRRISANSGMADIRPDEWLLELAGNVRLVVPAGLDGISTFVFLEQEDWFEDEAPFVRALAPHLNVALDIGANLGFYAATLAAARVSVLAFEPQPALADKLRRSAAAMPGAQLAVFETALGDAPGTAEFGGHQFHEGAHLGAGGALRVQVQCLDDVLPPAYVQAVDFAKIDIEGAELSAIRGASGFLGAGNPLVMIEIRDGANYDLKPLQALEAHGFERYRLVPALNCLVPMGGNPEAPDQLNAFAAKPARAEALAKLGLLCRTEPVDDLPGADGYARGLAHHARSRDAGRTPGQRHGDLLHALALLEAAPPSLARDLSAARAFADLGRRRRASRLIEPHVAAALAGTLEVPAAPFLCPLPRYEGRESPMGKTAWFRALVLESFHELNAPSSLFAEPAGREQALEFVIAAGLATPGTVRRLFLYRLATGRPAAKAPHPALAVAGPGNLNAAFWKYPQLYGG
jgi:FkbM family methyltransferase